MNKEKKMTVAALCGLVIVIVAIILLIPTCSTNKSDVADPTEKEGIALETTDDKDEATAKDTPSSEKREDASSGTSDNAGVGNATNSVGSSTNPSGNSTSSSAGSTSSKKWVPDYKKIWVEDSAAWDEQVPIYNEIEVSICNVCGAEITGNEVAHAKQHALAGEGGGHHNDYRSVITGYETVHHDATGHYETIEDGGHWE